ncbi:hypothetical protein BpHYR1_007557 [Brachionus plicatilis]|uniref:Uncharacterized protein n=1 Tax=Brachionus plicatilis TaxID=10195 RepID=A0A3M7S1Q2_BRAPC|nr:hypothetical protein BpHYR1_007557 [Brachionus plicatilis]
MDKSHSIIKNLGTEITIFILKCLPDEFRKWIQIMSKIHKIFFFIVETLLISYFENKIFFQLSPTRSRSLKEKITIKFRIHEMNSILPNFQSLIVGHLIKKNSKKKLYL